MVKTLKVNMEKETGYVRPKYEAVLDALVEAGINPEEVLYRGNHGEERMKNARKHGVDNLSHPDSIFAFEIGDLCNDDPSRISIWTYAQPDEDKPFILVYDAKQMKEGDEVYKFEFKGDPKKALVAIIKLNWGRKIAGSQTRLSEPPFDEEKSQIEVDCASCDDEYLEDLYLRL